MSRNDKPMIPISVRVDADDYEKAKGLVDLNEAVRKLIAQIAGDKCPTCGAKISKKIDTRSKR